MKQTTATLSRTTQAVRVAIAIALVGGIGLLAAAAARGANSIQIQFAPSVGARVVNIPASSGGEFVALGTLTFDRSGDRRSTSDVVVSALQIDISGVRTLRGARKTLERPWHGIKDLCVAVAEGTECASAPTGLFPVDTKRGAVKRGRLYAVLYFQTPLVIAPHEKVSRNLLVKTDFPDYAGFNNISSFKFRLGKRTSKLRARSGAEGDYTYGKVRLSSRVRGKVAITAPASGALIGKAGLGGVPKEEIDGYIIQLKEKPLLERYAELQPVRNAKRRRNGLVVKALNDQQSRIAAEQTGLKKRLSSAVRGKNPVIPEFQKTFNGIALKNVTDNELREIAQLPEVKDVFPNYEVHTMLLDSIPHIGADVVWELNDPSGRPITGEGVTIAVIDTGVDYTHPDLGGCTTDEFLSGACEKVRGGYDIINGDVDPIDDMGHGTHVASTAAGSGVLNGVAPGAVIYAYKVFSKGKRTYDSTVLEGIERAVDINGDNDFSDHADIISMSLGKWCGVYSSWCGPDDVVSRAIDNAALAGVVSVIAAGNDGPRSASVASPGTARKAITVGATYDANFSRSFPWRDVSPRRDQITSFSSRGPVIWEGGALLKPDIVAPGAMICAARYDSITLSDPYNLCLGDGKHIELAGTSMATPHVSGLAALVKQAHPSWTARDIKQVLRSTAVDLGLPYSAQGYGRIDAVAAVTAEQAPKAEITALSGRARNTSIIGTAAADNFSRYQLFAGNGLNPTHFTLMSTGNAAVINGPLFTGFDRSAISDYVVLRLVVVDKNGMMSEDRMVVEPPPSVHIVSPNGAEVWKLARVIAPIEYALMGDFKGARIDFYLIKDGKTLGRLNAWPIDLDGGTEKGIIGNAEKLTASPSRMFWWDTRYYFPNDAHQYDQRMLVKAGTGYKIKAVVRNQDTVIAEDESDFAFRINPYYGDIDENASVTVSDALLVERHLNEPGFELRGEQAIRADVDLDGRITPADREAILNLAVGNAGVLPLVWGDVDNDGIASYNDMNKILRHVLGTAKFQEKQQLFVADVDRDRRITNADALAIEALWSGSLHYLPVWYGDVNNDGRIASTDALIAERHVKKLAPITDTQALFVADVNVDGIIDQTDVDLISKRAVGTIDVLPVLP